MKSAEDSLMVLGLPSSPIAMAYGDVYLRSGELREIGGKI